MIAKTSDSQYGSELVDQITVELRQLSNEKLDIVREFVAFLASREDGDVCLDCLITPHDMTLASEAALKKHWDTPVEDATWADL